jgi:carbon monoxide dehydrogenase subunit G
MEVRLEHTFRVARPPEVVFDFLADPTNLPRWDGTGATVEVLTDGPPRVGTQIRQRGKALRLVGVEQVSELTVFERPHRLASKGVEGPVLPISGSYELTPDGDGTRVRFEVAYEVHRFRHRLLMPIVRRVSARGLAIAYRRFSAVLEGDPHGAHAHDRGHEH